MGKVEHDEADVEEEGVEGEDKTVESPLLLLESDHNSQEGVEEYYHKKVEWVVEKDQARYDEVGLAYVPLLHYLHRRQVLEGYALPLLLLNYSFTIFTNIVFFRYFATRGSCWLQYCFRWSLLPTEGLST